MTDVKPGSGDKKPNRGGRPCLGDKPMTAAEASRRARLRRKMAKEAERSKPSAPTSAEDVLAALCQSRRIVSHFDRLLAVKVVNCLIEGKIAEAVRALDHLPPPSRSEEVGSTHGGLNHRERVYQLIVSAIAGDQVEQAPELERLRAENEALRARLGETLPVSGTGSEPVSGTSPKVITPRTGDIVPPGEQSDLAANARRQVGADDWKAGPKPVLDLKPEPESEAARIERLRQQYCPHEQPWSPPAPNSPPVARPAWLTRIQQDLANAAARVETARVMTAPGRVFEPQPSGGESVYGMIERLNRRAY